MAWEAGLLLWPQALQPIPSAAFADLVIDVLGEMLGGAASSQPKGLFKHVQLNP